MDKRIMALTTVVVLGLFGLSGIFVASCGDNDADDDKKGKTDPKTDDDDNNKDDDDDPELGDSEFYSDRPGGGGGRNGDDADFAGGGGEPSADAGADESAKGDDQGGGEETNKEEESDIVIIKGDLLYSLNTYRGLQIIDVSDKAAPKIKQEIRLRGTPREMYIRDDGIGYILTTSYWDYWVMYGDSESPDEGGSILTVIDVSGDFAQVKGELNFPGYARASRILNGVLYVAAERGWGGWWNCWGPYDCYYAGGGGYAEDVAVGAPTRGFAPFAEGEEYRGPISRIVAIDLADPNNLKINSNVELKGSLERAEFTFGRAAMVRSQYDYSENYYSERKTLDVVELDGATARLGGSYEFYKRDSSDGDNYYYYWSYPRALEFNEYEIRLITRGWDYSSSGSYERSKLFLFDSSNANEVKLLSETSFNDEGVSQAAFSGDSLFYNSQKYTYNDNGYTTYEDWLVWLDISNPEKPTEMARLTLSKKDDYYYGWSSALILWNEDTLMRMNQDYNYRGDDYQEKVNLSMYKIAGESSEGLLFKGKAEFDGWYGWTKEAPRETSGGSINRYEDFAVVPVSGRWSSSGQAASKVFLVEVKADDLAKRGSFEYESSGSRMKTVETYLTMTDDFDLAIADLNNPDAPKLLGKTELARDVRDLLVADKDHVVAHVASWYRDYQAEIRVLSAKNPDEKKPLATISAGEGYTTAIFSNPPYAYIASDGWTPGKNEGKPQVTVVDFSKPASPVVRGKLNIKDAIWGYWDAVAEGSNIYRMRTRWEYKDPIGKDCYGEDYSDGYYGEEDAPSADAGSPDEGDRDEESSDVPPPVEDGEEIDAGVEEGESKPDEREYDCYYPDPDVYQTITIYDFSNPDKPVVASEFELKSGEYGYNPFIRNGILYFTAYNWYRNDNRGQYFVYRIDVSDPKKPKELERVNVPGHLYDISADGTKLYTIDYHYEQSGDDYNYYNTFNILNLKGSKAYLIYRERFDGWLSRIILEGDYAYLQYSESSYNEKGEPVSPKNLLVTYLVSDAKKPTRLHELELSPRSYLETKEGGYLWSRIGYGGNSAFEIISLKNPAKPELIGKMPAPGYSTKIIVSGKRAIIAGGVYGIEVHNMP